MLFSSVISLSPEGTAARERLLREARAAAALNHPNVVAVYDVGEDRGLPFFVMELVEGAAVLAGGCYEYEAATPYLPIVEAFRRFLQEKDPALLRDYAGEAGRIRRLARRSANPRSPGLRFFRRRRFSVESRAAHGRDGGRAGLGHGPSAAVDRPRKVLRIRVAAAGVEKEAGGQVALAQ